MDIVVDIQGFRDGKENFIPKEVAIVAVNAPITGHWIIAPPYPFDDLPEKSRKENNWLSRKYHGIEWYDGETNLERFTLYLREITREVRYIYCRGHEKEHYLRRVLSRNIYNLEGISPAFKNLPEIKECKQRCSHHGLRFSPTFTCALRNVYKLKRWLIARDNHEYSDSSRDNLFHENCDESDGDDGDSEETDSVIFMKRSTNIEIISNIEAWRKRNAAEEKKNQVCDDVAKVYYNPNVKKNHLSVIDKSNNEQIFSVSNNSQSSVFENASSTANKSPSKIIQVIPTIRSTPRCVKNEYAGNLTSAAASQCQICRGLSCRQTTEGVDEVDCHCC